MNYKYISKNENDTIRLAENIESEKFENMVICLNGDLGSGKTLFVKGFANSLQVSETITSPSFTFMKEYNTGELPLYHMDVYRLEENSDTSMFEEYFYLKGISIIEWSDLIKESLPEERLEIDFKIIDDDTRVLILKPYGDKYIALCDSVL